MDVISRHEAEEEIQNKAVQRLRSRVIAGKALEELKTPEKVLRGEYQYTNPDPDCLWVAAGESNIISERKTMTGDWVNLNLLLQSEVKHKDPIEGSKRARRLAHVAAEELIRDESGKQDDKLGLSYVTETSFSRAGAGPSLPNKNLYTFVVMVSVNYRAKR